MAFFFVPTSIVNIRHATCEVYCGRGSPFGNPFEIGRDGTRADVCEKFIPYFNKKLTNHEFLAKVLALKDKRLGCWCRCLPSCNNLKCKSLRCHLETIVEFLENEK
jgi:hypothetical protein